MKNKLIDISRSITNDALVYPGDDNIEMSTLCDIDDECPCKITRLDGWSSHFLTHVDSPRHFHIDGATLSDLSLERFIGDTIVVGCHHDAIDAKLVKALGPIEGLNILFKTRHSESFKKNNFDKKHVYISKDGAEALVDAKVNMVGVDYLSVDRYGDEDYPAHRTLLGNNVLILEGTNLHEATTGSYKLIALPLKIFEGDGSPVRAVLTNV